MNYEFICSLTSLTYWCDSGCQLVSLYKSNRKENGQQERISCFLRGIPIFFSTTLESENQGRSQSKDEMHRPIFEYSFAELVALILLPGLTLYFLNKKRASVRGKAEDVDTGASGSMAAPTETNSDGSSPSPTKANNGASSSMAAPTETNCDGSSPSLTKANNGASSSLTGNCYEVFLSFRGPDTRHGFTDHLYKGLVDAGIDAFRDDDELCHGEDIRPVLMKAITSSKILIPIFSENYGTSSWCLDELVQIMERKNKNGQMVLPIFYKVKPADVGHQIGSFGETFHKREKRLLGRSSFDAVTLEKWKKALLEVSTLKGYEAQGSEVKLVKSIVRKVLNELKKKFELDISKNLVGIDVHVKEVMEFVDNKSHDTLFVGIHGMGGIGKTTLAKVIYNNLSNQFEHRSFIADVRESWKRNGIHYLQNKLVNDILNQNHDQDGGTNFISSKFKHKKVLILLDDVDNIVQLKHLAGNHDWFYPGSKIIITSRNKKILKQIGVDYTYDHREMDDVHSLILFSKHAFRRDSPSKDFKDLTHEVVSLTGGLPLSLEVLGSLLCGEKPEFWRGTIEKLKIMPCKEVQETLKISYEALENEQKQIFLDISCFFIGTDSRIASYMWDACHFFPKEGIEVLRFMSLIKIGDDHQLEMHDHLRDLGRTIVRQENPQEPQKRSRLWDPEEALKVLKRNKGTDKIKAIDLSKGNSEGLGKIVERDGDNYTAEQFKKLTSLRFLFMKGAHLSGDFEDSMEELKWLQWQECPTRFEVDNFHMQELVVLELKHSEINEKWGGWSFFKMAKKLKYLDLSFCGSLENTDFLSAFEKLEVLILSWCTSLKRMDASIEDREGLLRLELGSSRALHLAVGADTGAECHVPLFRELPAELGKLKALQQLNLSRTRSLSALPNSIGSLENLEILDISDSGIEELPNGIGNLRKLRELRAFDCSNLKRIMVESMCNLSSLRLLDFFMCFRLQSLPDLPSSLTYLGVTCRSRKLPSLSHLTHLKDLFVRNCEFLQCIQELLSTQLKSSKCSQLTNIEESESLHLRVWSCKSIEMLDVSQFIHLRILNVYNCNNLLEVRVLDKSIYLESLAIASCGSIKRLDLPKLEGLKKLLVERCNKLAEIQGLDRLEYLESLDITRCASIERLNLPKFGRLKELLATSCKNLAEIEGLDRSEYLESLDIRRCFLIEMLDLPKSGRLKELKATSCQNLAAIKGLDRSEYLESLNIYRFTLIERLDLSKFKRLKELEFIGCINLTEIQGLDSLEYLEHLDIYGCTSIERLDFPKFGRLKELHARGCVNLAEIQGLDSLEYLEHLDISGCTSIERLDLPKSRSMKRLDVDRCEKLAEIQSLHRLESLEELNISWCTSIERLLLPKSESLKILEARDCENLVEIQGLDRLEFLEQLNIIGCKSLKTIPKLSGTRIYQYYEIANWATMEYESDYMDYSDDSDE